MQVQVTVPEPPQVGHSREEVWKVFLKERKKRVGGLKKKKKKKS